MNIILLVPVVLSFFLLGAHFLREGQTLIVFCVVLLPFLLAIRKPWVVRLLQFLLVAGALEWMRTLLFLRAIRIEQGMPWMRLVLIVGGVAMVTACSALVFYHASLKNKYGLNKKLTRFSEKV
ncbi:MAG: hypothetical protein ACI8ZB_004121 [Desulforhopalus sp.]|jgi:hypothetical protein